MQSPPSNESFVSPQRVYLLVENPQKSNNLGPILRCAAAFGIEQVVAVGFDKCSTMGSHGAAKHVTMVAFPTVKQAVSYLRSQTATGGGGGGRGISLIGLLGGVADAYDSDGYDYYGVPDDNNNNDDDDDNKKGRRIIQQQVVAPKVPPPAEMLSSSSSAKKRSFPIHIHPFVKGNNCCFVISKNYNKGLPSSLANQCDFFVHIPHVELSMEGKTTLGCCGHLLDSPSCLSIALHHFTAWAKYDVRDFQGHKFEVGGRERSDDAKEATRVARAEARRRMESAEAIIDGDTLGDMFRAEPSDDY